MKIYCQREVDYFTTSDTTQEPGFPSMFHRILSMGAALDYCLQNEMTTRAKMLQGLIDKMEEELLEFFATRNKDEQFEMVLEKTNNDYGL